MRYRDNDSGLHLLDHRWPYNWVGVFVGVCSAFIPIVLWKPQQCQTAEVLLSEKPPWNGTHLLNYIDSFGSACQLSTLLICGR
jgi:hypothetical protein